jgi:transitional endoplasmic reticulum ATPase
VFIEDVDTFANQTDPMYITRLLDTFDSARNKGIDLTLVMTTNHKNEIHKGMLRPGRLDAIIEIGAMDRPGVEKLAHLVIGDNLEDDVDFDQVFEATEGYMPAFVREGLERAIRYTIARTRQIGKINTTDLLRAMGSLRPQHDLHEGASDRREKLPPLDRVFREMMNEEVSPPIGDIEEVVANVVTQKMHGAVLANIDSGKRSHVIHTADS